VMTGFFAGSAAWTARIEPGLGLGMGLSPMGNEGGFGLLGWSNDLVGMREVEDVEERDIVFVCYTMILLCLNVFFL